MSARKNWYSFFFGSILLMALSPRQDYFAQAPVIQWEKSFGGTDADDTERIIQTSDGGYLLLGWSYSNDGDIGPENPTTDADIWIAKLDPAGKITWKKTIWGTNWDVGLDIKQVADGGYIVSGHTYSDDGVMPFPALGGSDAFIMKLDALGNIQWVKTYGGAAEDVLFSIEPTTDGGYIAAGYTGSRDHDVTGLHGDYDAWIVKVDAAGNIQWQRCVGGTDRDIARSVKPAPDGGYIFTGRGKSNDGDITNPKGQDDLIVGKLDAQGNFLWLKNYGGSRVESGWNVLVTADGGYIVTGYNFSPDGDAAAYYGQNDVWILKLDGQGNLVWQKVYGGYDYEDPWAIAQTSDGGYIVGGRTMSVNGDVSTNRGGNDSWLLKLDGNGSLQWEKTIGGSQQDVCHDIIPTADGGYLALGTTWSNDGDVSLNRGRSDIWLVKLIGCQLNTPAVPTINSGSPTPCAGTTVTYSVTPVNDATGYTWSVPAGWTIISGQGTMQITVLTGNNAGDLAVFAFNDCKVSGKRILASTPVINPVAQLTISSNQGAGICKGASVVFTAQPVNAFSPTYQWKKNGVNVGSNSPQYTDNSLSNNDLITCEMISTPACGSPVTVLSQPITAIVNQPITPAITISSNLTAICQGTGVNFIATTINGGSQPQYTWYVNNTATGGNGSSFNSQALSDGDVITCSVNSSETCVTSAVAFSNPITITVNTNVNAEVSISTPATTICKDDEVTFTATASNAGTAPTYLWTINGVTTGINNATFRSSDLSDQDQITCTIVPGQNTCATTPATSNTITITINELPNITLYPSDTIVAPGTQVSLVTSISQDIRSFHWTPDAKLINPASLTPTTIPVMDAITYRLAIITMDGCRVYRDATITPEYPFKIPNAFTPNGDNNNDLFRIPPYSDFELSELIVYNRFGQIVFSTRDINAGWDGRFRGQVQPIGTYVYQISGVLKGKKVLVKGAFTLIR